jgi:hypothetical protein
MAKADSTPVEAIAFTAVKFVDFHFVGKPKRGPGGPSLRVYFEAAWLEPIRQSMGWQDVDPDTVRGTLPLKGALIGSEVTLVPVAEGLAQHTIKVRAQAIRNFEVFFPEQTGKKPKPPVLRFRIETHDEKGEVLFGQWGRILNDATAQLEVVGGEMKKNAGHANDEDEDDGQEKLPLVPGSPAADEHKQRTAGKKKDSSKVN